ncbi:MAG: glycoside hydrolase [Verrucomicrobiaceae bacterium]|nr:glycoside hydrolase [Verrucomicrobiaceae bacterium]
MRFRSLPFIVFFVLTALLAGCAGQRVETQPQPPVSSSRNDLNNSSWVKQTLYAQYSDWKNVKYKGGGLSKGGVDCSGFVFLTFDARFGIKLPRSTEDQVNVGTTIQQRDLIPGDLIFFKTGKTMRHVGIYLEDGKFLHASTEKGVMISNLDDQYWLRTYWKSVRVKT